MCNMHQQQTKNCSATRALESRLQCYPGAAMAGVSTRTWQLIQSIMGTCTLQQAAKQLHLPQHPAGLILGIMLLLLFEEVCVNSDTAHNSGLAMQTTSTLCNFLTSAVVACHGLSFQQCTHACSAYSSAAVHHTGDDCRCSYTPQYTQVLVHKPPLHSSNPR
jgi:hypothetical protein